MGLENLINPITDVYGKSATGFDYGTVRQSLKEDRDYKRGEIKSFFDITADLDAAAFSAVKQPFDEIKAKIENNELKVGTPDFEAARSKMRSVAKTGKELQDLLKKQLTSYADDPSKFAYIEGAQGYETDTSFEGIMRAADEISRGSYKDLSEYSKAVTGLLSKVQPKIDERLFAADVQKIAEQNMKRAIENVSLSGQTVPVLKIGNTEYYEVPVEMVNAMKVTKDTVKSLFPHAQKQLGASRRSKGAIPSVLSNEGDFDQQIENLFAGEYLARFEGKKPTQTVRQESFAEKKYKSEMAKLQDQYKNLKEDVKLFQNGDETSIQKYLPNHLVQIQDGYMVLAELGKSKDEPARVVSRVDLNDAEGIYQAIADQSKDKNMTIEAINMGNPVSSEGGGETPKQVRDRFNVDKMFKGLNPPTVDADGKQIKDDEVAEKRQKSINYLNSIDGVSFIQGTGYFGDSTKDRLKIDGVTYDLTDEAQAQKANLKIKEKIAGKQTESGKSSIPEISSEAEYNKLKPGDKYVWGGKEYTKK